MTVLSDTQIKKYVKEEKLIEPFDETLLGPATYDLRVGRRVLRSLKKEGESPLLNLEQERVLQIGTGEFVEIMTMEKVRLSKKLCGRMGIRSYFTRKGLVSFVGPQVDPGFEGSLVISLFNTGPRPIVVKYGEPFCTIEFHELSTPCEKPYSGPYQGQDDFPSDNIEFVVGAKGITLGEVVDVMRGLRSDMKWMKWLLALIFATLIGLLVTRAL
jgi:dCTP deaminase